MIHQALDNIGLETELQAQRRVAFKEVMARPGGLVIEVRNYVSQHAGMVDWRTMYFSKEYFFLAEASAIIFDAAQSIMGAVESNMWKMVAPEDVHTSLYEYLNSFQYPHGSPENPITVTMNFDSLTGIRGTIINSFKFINLDLSGSTITSIGIQAFDLLHYNRCGIIGIIIPASVTSIGQSAFTGQFPTSVTFLGSISEDDFALSSFVGDLRDVYFSVDGGPGIYNVASGYYYCYPYYTWSKQQ